MLKEGRASVRDGLFESARGADQAAGVTARGCEPTSPQYGEDEERLCKERLRARTRIEHHADKIDVGGETR